MKLLRVEGVNMRFLVKDTQDLKTISGGSQMLLNAVNELADWPPLKGKLRSISIGASSGLFEVLDPTVTSDMVAKELRDRYPHATFVAHEAEGPEFPSLEEKARAANRWGQMAQPSLPFPQAGGPPCVEDKLRPSASKSRSPSVDARRDLDKSKFYETFAGRPGLKLCQDLSTLAADEGRANLNGKIAVIYADGNHFGSLISSQASTPEALRSVDETIRAKRKTLLGAVVDHAERTPGGQVRLETLLWGGDELIWVVPAWRGWETLQHFYENARWAIQPRRGDSEPAIVDGSTSESDDIPLYHAAGLVFCHASAHIHRITALAKDLADIAKEKSRTRSLFAYQVLESFDATGLDLEGFRKKRAPTGASMVLDGSRMGEIAGAFQAYKNTDPPRSKVHALGRAILGRANSVDAHTLEQHDGTGTLHPPSIDLLSKRAAGDFEDIDALTGPLRTVDVEEGYKDAVPWVHIAELWDYLGAIES